MKVTDIKAHEGNPIPSAFDPYGLTAFGGITFKVSGAQVSTPTYDRFTDYIYVGGKEYRLSAEDRIHVCNFIQAIWNLKEADMEVPDIVLKLVNN